MGVLDDILAQKRAELPGLRKGKLPIPPPIPAATLGRTPEEPLRLICEIKRRSPSAGALSTQLSVGARARIYEECGATMISVLCDEKFFAGRFEHLTEARSTTGLPLLCKEFVIDEIQLDHARAFGASAALLIVRCLRPSELRLLISAARQRELLPLVEVTSEDEAKIALDAGASHIGVNARDLDTLEMDAGRAARVLENLPEKIIRCHFSGVKSKEDVERVRDSGASAALIGEVLMRLDDPGPHLRSLVVAARPA